jgi:hypothetical protein
MGEGRRGVNLFPLPLIVSGVSGVAIRACVRGVGGGLDCFASLAMTVERVGRYWPYLTVVTPAKAGVHSAAGPWPLDGCRIKPVLSLSKGPA